MRRTIFLTATILGAAVMAAPGWAASYKFELVGTVKLPGKTGHGDIVTYDPGNKMIYVSLADNGLAVVDPQSRKVVADIPDVPAPDGNAADDHYVYVAAGEGAGAGKTNAIVVIDKQTWKVVDRVATKGTSPDWIAVNPKRHLVYVDSDDNNWMEVYSSGAHPQFKEKWDLYPAKATAGPDVATLVPARHVIYQSDDGFVDEIDTSTGKVERHMDTGVKLLKHGGTKGSVYDAERHHLWVATTNKEPGIFVLNPTTLAVIKKLPETGGVDQVSWDPKLGLVYAFEGGAKGFDVYDAKTMEHVTFVSTGVGTTHTGDVDTATHLVFAYQGGNDTLGIYKPAH